MTEASINTASTAAGRPLADRRRRDAFMRAAGLPAVLVLLLGVFGVSFYSIYSMILAFTDLGLRVFGEHGSRNSMFAGHVTYETVLGLNIIPSSKCSWYALDLIPNGSCSHLFILV